MDLCDSIFKRKSFDAEQLLLYGFVFDNGVYTYSAQIMDNKFLLTVNVADNRADCGVSELSTNEPFALFNVTEASGAFIGQMRAEAQTILEDIAEKCCYIDIFKSEQAKFVIAYAKEKYGDTPEYLWEKFPDNAVLRRRDNKKWYAALLTVEKRKLGFEDGGRAEILDLRGDVEDLKSLIDGKKYLPGYHMNKRHWYTVCLDGSVTDAEIEKRINESYALAKK